MKTKKNKIGFAAMPKTKLRELASKGGKSVPKEKRAFFRDPQLAAEAGRKGGQVKRPLKYTTEK